MCVVCVCVCVLVVNESLYPATGSGQDILFYIKYILYYDVPIQYVCDYCC